mgnify:CR=1 FL=1
MKNKSTLIVPAAGKSSRYPGMRPKWLLTHPDGRLMIDKVISSFLEENPNSFDRIIVTVLNDHCEKYDADTILNQVFGKKVEVLSLKNPTSSASETVYETLKQLSVTGKITIKDTDCLVRSKLPSSSNHIVGLSVSAKSNIDRVQQKSFIIKNDDDIITDIIEKEMVSNIICLGVYSSDANEFCRAYEKIRDHEVYKNLSEVYVSHVISYLIVCEEAIFEYVEADEFIDWGTKEDWYEELGRYKTYIFDIDGVLLKNSGRFGKNNWSNYFEPIQENIDTVKRLSKEGNEIIFMTARTEEFLLEFRQLLKDNDIQYKQIISGCNHSRRIIINDFAPTNPHPSCQSISIKRNELLGEYIT